MSVELTRIGQLDLLRHVAAPTSSAIGPPSRSESPGNLDAYPSLSSLASQNSQQRSFTTATSGSSPGNAPTLAGSRRIAAAAAKFTSSFGGDAQPHDERKSSEGWDDDWGMFLPWLAAFPFSFYLSLFLNLLNNFFLGGERANGKMHLSV